MLHLNIGNATENVVVTLEEKRTITAPFYMFIFTHATTKEQVSVTFDSSTEELSQYVYRYNEYAIRTASLFAGKPIGEWLYEVLELAGVNEATSTDEIDLLNPASTRSFGYTGGTFNVGDRVRVFHSDGNFFDGEVLELTDGGMVTTFENAYSTAPSFDSWTIRLIDPPADGNVVESGKMFLNGSTDFEYTQYQGTTTYAEYGG